MKFRANIEPKYEVGTIKTVIRFAWWPVRIDNIKVWLQRYEDVYVWHQQDIDGKMGNEIMEFHLFNWLKVSRRVI